MGVLASAVDTWATVAVAIGTLGAVGYALFRDLIVAPRRRPSLELAFDRDGHDQLVHSGGAHVRMRVVNRPGKDTADEVVVVMTTLRRLSEPEETRPIGLPLTWSGSSPPLTVSSVHPGSERHVDLLRCDRRSGLRLDLSPTPATGAHVLESGGYELSVEVRARNADAIRYVIPVAWDGEQAGELWDHLRVEPPRPLR